MRQLIKWWAQKNQSLGLVPHTIELLKRIV